MLQMAASLGFYRKMMLAGGTDEPYNDGVCRRL
jgi:hypothetical protein